jgi:hypothetical protein
MNDHQSMFGAVFDMIADKETHEVRVGDIQDKLSAICDEPNGQSLISMLKYFEQLRTRFT